jgi:Domain of unknown function (DUF1707)
MASDSAHIRASDEDRDRVAGLLQEHHAEGRLSAEEFSERMDAALHARTLGELDELLADLPHVDRRHYQLPDAGINPRRDRLYNPVRPDRPVWPVQRFSSPNRPCSRKLAFGPWAALLARLCREVSARPY